MKDYSNRLNDLIEKGQEIVGESYQGNLHATGVVGWRGQLGEDGILSFLGLCPFEMTPIQQGISQALCQLIVGQKRSRLHEISLREVENYLRDDNGTPSFPLDGHLDSFFLLAKLGLEQSWIMGLFDLKTDRTKAWPSKTTEKILFLQDWLNNVAKPVLQGDLGDIEVVDLNSEEVVLKLHELRIPDLAPAYMSALKHFLEEEYLSPHSVLSFEE